MSDYYDGDDDLYEDDVVYAQEDTVFDEDNLDGVDQKNDSDNESGEDDEDDIIKDVDVTEEQPVGQKIVLGIGDQRRKTRPMISKYEKAAVVTKRVKQLNEGHEPVDPEDPSMEHYDIAIRELKNKTIPVDVIRQRPDGVEEIWSVKELAFHLPWVKYWKFEWRLRWKKV